MIGLHVLQKKVREQKNKDRGDRNMKKREGNGRTVKDVKRAKS
jgi:hypothetical protein